MKNQRKNDSKQKEVSKERFKEVYFKYGNEVSGWGVSYWNEFFENETDKTYYVCEPLGDKDTEMMISSDRNSHRLYFATEDAVEASYDYPGK